MDPRGLQFHAIVGRHVVRTVTATGVSHAYDLKAGLRFRIRPNPALRGRWLLLPKD